jgi:hypothetical protein
VILIKAFFFRKVNEVMQAAILSMYTSMLDNSADVDVPNGADDDVDNVTETFSGGERTEVTTVSQVSHHRDPSGGSVEKEEWRLHAQQVSYVVSTAMSTVDEKVMLC